MGEQENTISKCILLTGYGPFGVIAKNPSSEIVRTVRGKWKAPEHGGVDLVTYEEVQVCYDYIASSLPKWWQSHLPLFTVHIGVWKNAPSVFLECRAFNDRYVSPDVTGATPPRGFCCEEAAPPVLNTAFDVQTLAEALTREQIRDAKVTNLLNNHVVNSETADSEIVNVQQVKKSDEFVRVAVNSDPGRFLCGYVYYKSLTTDPRRRALFVHVPDADSPWSVESMAEVVYRLLDLLLQSACSKCSASIAACNCSHRKPQIESESGSAKYS